MSDYRLIFREKKNKRKYTSVHWNSSCLTKYYNNITLTFLLLTTNYHCRFMSWLGSWHKKVANSTLFFLCSRGGLSPRNLLNQFFLKICKTLLLKHNIQSYHGNKPYCYIATVIICVTKASLFIYFAAFSRVLPYMQCVFFCNLKYDQHIICIKKKSKIKKNFPLYFLIK